MSRSLLALSVCLALVACAPQTARHDGGATVSTATVVSADQQFASLSQRWLDGTMAASPVTATTVGDHRHDAELDDLGADGLRRSLEFSRGMLADLEKIDRSALSRENQ
ncbi:MAG TPA: DUF885 domain-containing protein, partial [Dokdonella sp.]